jgi:hypothetical protein
MRHVFGASENCVLISVGSATTRSPFFLGCYFYDADGFYYSIPSFSLLSFRQLRVKGESAEGNEKGRLGLSARQTSYLMSAQLEEGENKRRERVSAK